MQPSPQKSLKMHNKVVELRADQSWKAGVNRDCTPDSPETIGLKVVCVQSGKGADLFEHRKEGLRKQGGRKVPTLF